MNKEHIEAVVDDIWQLLLDEGSSPEQIAKVSIDATYDWLKTQGIYIPPLPATKLELEQYYRSHAMRLASELLDESLEIRGVKLGPKSPEGVDRWPKNLST